MPYSISTGLNLAIPDFDDTESVDNILTPYESDVAREYQIYTIGDLRQARRHLEDLVGEKLAQAMTRRLDENDGREP